MTSLSSLFSTLVICTRKRRITFHRCRARGVDDFRTQHVIIMADVIGRRTIGLERDLAAVCPSSYEVESSILIKGRRAVKLRKDDPITRIFPDKIAWEIDRFE